MVDTLSELSGLSSKLNTQSEKLNSIISSVNQRLKALNLGVEVWLKDEPIEKSGMKHRPDSQDCAVMYQEQKVFGYCRIDGEWELAVKTFWSDAVEEGDECEPTEMLDSEISLLKTSRANRIKALELLPDLLDEIKAGAQKMLDAISSAEEIAGNL